MSYLKISNLYQEQTILLFRECYALEKIHGCVKKGSLVRLADGRDVPIEHVEPGVAVLSYDEGARQFKAAIVDDSTVQERDVRLGWMEVTLIDGRSVVCTEDHPFYTINRGWVKATDLTASDDILTV